MHITITINCDNAAFADGNAAIEVAHILRGIARRYEDECTPLTLTLRDSCGNKVGYAEVVGYAVTVCKHCSARLIEDKDGGYVSVDDTSCCEISGHDALRK